MPKPEKTKGEKRASKFMLDADDVEIIPPPKKQEKTENWDMDAVDRALSELGYE